MYLVPPANPDEAKEKKYSFQVNGKTVTLPEKEFHCL